MKSVAKRALSAVLVLLGAGVVPAVADEVNLYSARKEALIAAGPDGAKLTALVEGA